MGNYYVIDKALHGPAGFRCEQQADDAVVAELNRLASEVQALLDLLHEAEEGLLVASLHPDSRNPESLPMTALQRVASRLDRAGRAVWR